MRSVMFRQENIRKSEQNHHDAKQDREGCRTFGIPLGRLLVVHSNHLGMRMRKRKSLFPPLPLRYALFALVELQLELDQSQVWILCSRRENHNFAPNSSSSIRENELKQMGRPSTRHVACSNHHLERSSSQTISTRLIYLELVGHPHNRAHTQTKLFILITSEFVNLSTSELASQSTNGS